MSKAAPTDSGIGAVLQDEQISWAVRRVIFLLTLVSILNFVDRQIINILAESIKKDLALSDSQIGLLTGLAFAVFYALLSLPAARLADRYNRPILLGAAVTVWSGFTALSGVAQNFTQLALARMGVGIGESACAPTAHSLISDYVPASKRTSALAMFSMGVPLGSMLGMVLGGIVVDHWGWRTALLMVGLPGLAVGLAVMFFAPEPRRTLASAAAATAKLPRVPLLVVMKLLLAKRSAWMIMASQALASMVQLGSYAWIASFFRRSEPEQLQRWADGISAFTGLSLGPVAIIGIVYGVATGLMAATGMYLSGRIADARTSRDVSVLLWLPAWAKMSGIVFTAGTLFSGDLGIALACATAHSFVLGFTLPPGYASVLGLVDSKSRATVTALFMIVTTFIGLGFGPLMVGVLSDFFNKGLGMGESEGLRYGMVTLALFIIPSSLLLLRATRYYPADFVK
ncbi:sugar efflux transporter [Alphaproteobacteria bacterium SO-S41]|nr:sugar efflux transporter [Alphaproteobacteria bacterium SO-S41]